MKLEKDFGQYGGQYVPETLMTVLKVLEKKYEEYCFTCKAYGKDKGYS